MQHIVPDFRLCTKTRFRYGVSAPCRFAAVPLYQGDSKPRKMSGGTLLLILGESRLYSVISESLETFLARQREQDRDIPGFVEREFREFLDCVALARGFIRVHCNGCGMSQPVGYSGRRRGFCNSCGVHRMADTAVHLTDRVFPRVPVRQINVTAPHLARRVAPNSRARRGSENEIGIPISSCSFLFENSDLRKHRRTSRGYNMQIMCNVYLEIAK